MPDWFDRTHGNSTGKSSKGHGSSGKKKGESFVAEAVKRVPNRAIETDVRREPGWTARDHLGRHVTVRARALVTRLPRCQPASHSEVRDDEVQQGTAAVDEEYCERWWGAWAKALLPRARDGKGPTSNRRRATLATLATRGHRRARAQFCGLIL